MNANIPPVKIEYDGSIDELPGQLEGMHFLIKTKPKTPYHSLRVFLNGDTVKYKESLIAKGKENGYHVISIEGELLLELDVQKGEDVLRFRPTLDAHTLIFYTEPEWGAA